MKPRRQLIPGLIVIILVTPGCAPLMLDHCADVDCAPDEFCFDGECVRDPNSPLPTPGLRGSPCDTDDEVTLCVDNFARQPAELVFFRPTSRWNRTALTWTFVNPLTSLDQSEQLVAAARVFARWAVRTPLTFTFIEGDADIEISFEDRFHRDPFPFDGPGRVKGHAYFPGSGRPGQIHLDSDEPWTLKPDTPGVELFPVLLHLVGHALGLEHSLDERAIMFPAIRLRDDRGLAPTDVAAIRDLYGSEDGLVSPVPVAAPPFLDVSPPDLTVADDPDSDGDGIPDSLEVFALNTDPFERDTDFDGLSDFEEVFLFGTPPTFPDNLPAQPVDSDDDGLFDSEELLFFGTDPLSADTDGDGSPDGIDPFPTNASFPPFDIDPPGPCVTDADCSDGAFCNGREVCVAGGCVDGRPPCGEGLACEEAARRCVVPQTCSRDSECDDDDCSNGVETCAAGQCRVGNPGETIILFDFESEPQPEIFVQSAGHRFVTRRRTGVLEFNWSLDETGQDDAFIVLIFDPINVTPCDRLVADIEVAQTQKPRLEAKLSGGFPKDIGSRELVPDTLDPIDTLEVIVSERYPLGEIAVTIERDLHSGTGTIWIDNIRLVRGQ